MATASMPSPVGTLHLRTAAGAVVALGWGEQPADGDCPALRLALEELTAYFEGRLQRFTVPTQPAGSDFQRAVCEAMSAIPFGETLTYGELARRTASAAQPVGNACGANSIPIIIPCHRVLAANGLGGYSGAGGLETKIALLKHEGAFPHLL